MDHAVDINAMNEGERTPLHNTAARNHVKIVIVNTRYVTLLLLNQSCVQILLNTGVSKLLT